MIYEYLWYLWFHEAWTAFRPGHTCSPLSPDRFQPLRDHLLQQVEPSSLEGWVLHDEALTLPVKARCTRLTMPMPFWDFLWLFCVYIYIQIFFCVHRYMQYIYMYIYMYVCVVLGSALTLTTPNDRYCIVWMPRVLMQPLRYLFWQGPRVSWSLINVGCCIRSERVGTSLWNQETLMSLKIMKQHGLRSCQLMTASRNS